MPNLTREQQDVVRKLVKNLKSQQIQTLGGFAGTGKTTVISFLAQVLNDFAICAYTGKAANVLRKKGMMQASTIHSLIYRPEGWGGQVEFVLIPPDEFGMAGFIVDEASMVSKDIYNDLLSFGKPIIFVGDHGQLEPVGSDVNVMADPMYRLETVHRNAGEIAHFAEHIRKGNSARTFEGTDRVELITPGAVSHEHLTGVDQIICAFNKFRVGTNKAVRELLGYGEELLAPGERVMCLRNSKEPLLFNGMQGTVERVDLDHCRMDFLWDELVYDNIWFDPAQFHREKPDFEWGRDTPHPFDYAYCVTAHKCVTPDTLVETPEGLMAIADLSATGRIATPDGVRPYRNKVVNQPGKVIRMITERGYELTMTPEHGIEVWDKAGFVRIVAGEAQIGQFVRLTPGVCCDPLPCDLPPLPDGDVRSRKWVTPSVMNESLGEFLGLMVAGGTVYKNGFRLAKRHADVVFRFETLCEQLFGVRPRQTEIRGTEAAEVSSVLLASWLREIGGLSPNAKDVPSAILRSPSAVHRAFLRGLFEDGTVNVRDGVGDHMQFTSHDKCVRDKVRLMLLRLGIISSSARQSIYLYGDNAIRFAKEIGFVADFKSNRLKAMRPAHRDYLVPVSVEESESLRAYLSPTDWHNVKQHGYISRAKAQICRAEWLEERLKSHYERIVKLNIGVAYTMCVEVPDGHRFLQNGFPFWNSQGDEWQKVMVYEQRCDKWDHQRWAYTSASRAKEKLFWVAQKKFIPRSW